MVGDSKILTVSYGTFSCTLEGFDDPFSTMKAIAEYFRDLAAGDRFFGAEPPQPDTDLLHKIAEETIQRQVNAEVSGDSLILRQADSAPQTPAPVVAPVAAAAVAQPVETGEDAPLSSVAEKLKRIRAVVANEAARNLAFDEDQHADTFDASPVEGAPVDAELAETDTVTDEFVAPEADQPADEASVEEDSEENFDVASFIADDASLEDTAPAAPEVDIATDATPADYENVLEDDASVEEAAFEDEFEDETSNAFAEELSEEPTLEAEDEGVSEESAEAEAPAALDETVETVQEETPTLEEYEDEEMSSETLAAFAEDLPEEDVTDEIDQPEISEEVEETSDEIAELEEDLPVEGMSDELADDEFADDEPEMEDVAENSDDVSEEAFDDVDEVTDEDVEPEQKPRLDVLTLVNPINTSDEDDDDLQNALEAELGDAEEEQPKPRVVVQHISRADLLANLSDEVASETADEASEDTDGVVDIEAELARELNAMDEFEEEAEEEDLAEEDMAALQSMLAESAQAEAEDARQARIQRRTEQPFEDGEAALARLMDETSKIEEDDEGSIRRASIAHLKAAVAANKADASIAEAAAAEDERELDQYREDLARVVRPGRARKREDGEKTNRPEAFAEGAQPLVLVGEQRIEDTDATAPADAASVQPRRISASELAMQEEENLSMPEPSSSENGLSFADYADTMEASELPDLLEAAAAHTIYIEGMSSFTRPMLMRKMDTVNQNGEHTRETILRSFGTLLRQGKIIKNKDGNFVIAKTSRFTPEARYAGE